MATLNLIGVLNAYLFATLFLGLALNYRRYQAIAHVILAAPGRWPRLVSLVRGQHSVLLTPATLRPLAVMIGVTVAHSLAYNFLWPAARVTPADLGGRWLALAAAAGTAAAMLWLDGVALFAQWEFDRAGLEKQLDQAEFWLGSWVAPTLRVLTFGFLNPRRLVQAEVQKALAQATADLNLMLWRWSLQTGVRLVFGAALWLTWASS
jgi:hypothetical protein